MSILDKNIEENIDNNLIDYQNKITTKFLLQHATHVDYKIAFHVHLLVPIQEPYQPLRKEYADFIVEPVFNISLQDTLDITPKDQIQIRMCSYYDLIRDEYGFTVITPRDIRYPIRIVAFNSLMHPERSKESFRIPDMVRFAPGTKVFVHYHTFSDYENNPLIEDSRFEIVGQDFALR